MQQGRMQEISERRDRGEQYGLYGPLAIFSGTANPELAQEIADRLQQRLGQVTICQFANQNIFAKLNESVRSKDVFLIQPTCPGVRNRKHKSGECVVVPDLVARLQPDEFEEVPASVNDNILELLVLIDTLRRDSAGRITAVIPYFAYGRTDKKDQPRVPITARLMADVVSVAGANRFLVIDLHAGQIQGFFDIPGDELTARHILVDYFRDKGLRNAVVVAPDIGASRRARNFAERPGSAPGHHREAAQPGWQRDAPAQSHRQRTGPAMPSSLTTRSTRGGPSAQAAEFVRQRGALDVYACATHALLSPPEGVENMKAAKLKELVVTNTVYISPRSARPCSPSCRCCRWPTCWPR